VRATDGAGNTDASEAVRTWTVDLQDSSPEGTDPSPEGTDPSPDGADPSPDGTDPSPDGTGTPKATPHAGDPAVQARIVAAAARDAKEFGRALRKLGLRKAARRGAFQAKADATLAGIWRIEISASQAGAARKLTVARARKTFAGPAAERVKVKLTKVGKRLFRKPRKRLRVRVTVSFSPRGGRTVSKSKSFR
jgi:hypothetical protein